jgi:hypothetical protein
VVVGEGMCKRHAQVVEGEHEGRSKEQRQRQREGNQPWDGVYGAACTDVLARRGTEGRIEPSEAHVRDHEGIEEGAVRSEQRGGIREQTDDRGQAFEGPPFDPHHAGCREGDDEEVGDPGGGEHPWTSTTGREAPDLCLAALGDHHTDDCAQLYDATNGSGSCHPEVSHMQQGWVDEEDTEGDLDEG